MKADADVRTTPLPAALLKAADYLELTKPRIAAMVLVTTLTGLYMGHTGTLEFSLVFHTLLGTGLVGMGASAINQVIERGLDAEMLRTRNRPLPAGRLTVNEAVTFSAAISILGTAYLFLTTNALATLVAAATLGLYAFVYTPLKRITTLNTIVGAVPGAMPPLIGWAAGSGSLPIPAWTLFLILFIWQIPHFMAIAWLYRADYARGGFKMLPVVDADGSRTAQQIVGQGIGLVGASLLPSLYGLTGRIYFFAALALGLAFCGFGIVAALKRTSPAARWLLLASVIYLPLLFAVMMLDKIR